VHWRLKATDGSNNDSAGEPIYAQVYGTQSLDVSDLSSFTAFSSLSSSDVQGWVEASMGADAVTKMKSELDAVIAELVTPTSVQKTIG